MLPAFRISTLVTLLTFAFTSNAQLSGTYTIDAGGGGDYLSFTTAVADLNSLGINAPVLFEVLPGTYTEQIVLSSIVGSSATNTITFRGQTLDSTDALLGMPATSTGSGNYVVNLNGVQHVRFEHLTLQRTGTLSYGRIISTSSNGSSDWRFSNCRFITSPSSVTGTREALYVTGALDLGNSLVENSAITNGTGVLISNCSTGSVIMRDNTFLNVWHGLRAYTTSCGLNFSNNTVECPAIGSTRGIILESGVTGDVVIEGNNISGTATTFFGIILGTASGTLAVPIQIRNNTITASNSSLVGLSFQTAVSYVDVVHNSISMTGGFGTPQAFVMVTSTGVGHRIHNNIFYSVGTTMRVTPSSQVASCDNNVYFSTAGYGVQWGSTYYTTVPTLYGASGMNTSSIMADPLFMNSGSDLHLNSGSPALGNASLFGGLIEDIDQEPRPQPVASTPDIGSDENSLACAGMNGTYVIGGSALADYATFNAAVNDLITCGLSGATVFEVEDGTYNERVTLPAITGSSTTNTVSFQGQSGDSTLVVLNGFVTSQYTFLFDGCYYSELKWIKVLGSNLGVGIVNGASFIGVSNCEVECTSSTAIAVGDETPSVENDITLTNNRIYGSYGVGISCRGISTSNRQSGIIIDGNFLEGSERDGIEIQYCESISLKANYVLGTAITTGSSDNGIAVTDCRTPLVIEKNTVDWNLRGPGLQISTITRVGTDSLRLTNNMISHLSASGSIEAVSIEYSPDAVLYHNSFYAPFEALSMQYSANSILVGNIYSSDLTAPFASVFSTPALADQNVFYSPVGYVSGFSTLAAWQTSTGTEQFSIFADPLFVSTSDLHLQAGSPAAGMVSIGPPVLDDIDQESRPQPVGYPNDAGADETATGCSALAGTYVVGVSASANYLSFNEAVTALTNCGISGPVVFEVEDGLYNETVSIGPISGTSATNTITFSGQSMDSTQVVLSRFSSNSSFGSNYTLRLFDAEYVTFQHMTIQRSGSSTYAMVVDIVGSSSNITFRRTRLKSGTGSANTYNKALIRCWSSGLNQGILLQENNFEYGSTGIFWNGYNAADQILVEGNRFYHSLLRFQDIPGGGIELYNNYFDSNLTGGNTFMVQLSNCDGNIKFHHNEMDIPNTTGLYALNCNGISGNEILIAHNMIYGTGTAMNLSSCTYTELIHNSFSGGTYITNCANISSLNNIYSTTGTYAQTVNPTSAFVQSDHNLYHGGASTLVRWNNVNHISIAAMNGATGTDSNSKSGDPLFISPVSDLHLQVGSPAAGVGLPLAGYVLDFDDENIPQPAATDPDIGADETADYCFVLSGTYLIGPSAAADFASFGTAIGKMLSCGISGPVIFEVEDGTYTEQLVLPPVSGSSATNTIIFRGQSQDSSLVTLRLYAQNTSANNYLISMQGMDHVAFEHMGLMRYGVSSSNRFGRVVDYAFTADASQYTRFSNIWFSSGFYYPYINYSQLVYANNTLDEEEVLIENSRFASGSHAVYWDANGGDDRLTIKGCSVVYTYEGLFCYAFNGDLLIEDNVINGLSSSNANPEGVYLSGCLGGFTVVGNRITLSRGYGILTSASNGSGASPGLIMNNSVIVYSNYSSDVGLYLTGNCSNVHVLNNSISTFRGRGYYDATLASFGMRLTNNIMRSGYSNGYPIYKTGSGVYTECSHNVLYNSYSTGVLARWNGTHYDMPALQAASGLFSNSFDLDPMFVSNSGDLHLQPASLCAGLGKALSDVLVDIDGEARPNPVATNMDVGADETPGFCQDLSGSYIIGSSVAADFPNFSSAVGQMVRCGISGPVVFDVEPGFYYEQISLDPISGNDATNTITFQGQSGDSTDVDLRWNSSIDISTDYVVNMAGADYVTFQYISIRRTGSASASYYSAAVHYQGSDPSVHSAFRNCWIYAIGRTNQSRHRLVKDLCTVDQERIEFTNVRLDGGYYGMHFEVGYHQEDIFIEQNEFYNSTVGLAIVNLGTGGSLIRGNEMLSLANSATGIGVFIVDGSGKHVISGNRIRVMGTGISFSSVYVSPADGSEVVSNEVISTGGIGISMTSNTSHVRVANNTISGNTLALSLGTAVTNTQLFNNIFYTPSAVYSVDAAAGAVSASDRNIFYRGAGAGDVQWAGNSYSSVAALNGFTGLDANSFFADPALYNPLLDLRSYSMHANNAGTPLAYVSTDIDGNLRHAATPDIGAFEFTPELWNEQLDVCHAFDQLVSTGTGLTQYIYADRKVVGSLNDNSNTLAAIDGSIYINSGALRFNALAQFYMDRNWQIEPANAVTGANVDVRLYYDATEFATLVAGDPSVTTTADVGVSQYDGPNENCQLADNTTVGNYFVHYPVPAGTEGELAPLTQVGYFDISLPNFSEFYITGQGNPLPVELIAMDGQRLDIDQVELTWATASEQDNQGFEVYRQRTGEASFEFVGWVAGLGNSVATQNYRFIDQNRTDKLSYYFLRQIDHNGQSEDLPLVAVEGMDQGNGFIPFPNPATGSFSLLGGVDLIRSVSVIDASGRVVRQYTQPQFEYDVRGVRAGVYTVVVELLSGNTEASRLCIE